eukprot:5165791-Alexandrium_andersonii.AAC.1
MARSLVAELFREVLISIFNCRCFLCLRFARGGGRRCDFWLLHGSSVRLRSSRASGRSRSGCPRRRWGRPVVNCGEVRPQCVEDVVDGNEARRGSRQGLMRRNPSLAPALRPLSLRAPAWSFAVMVRRRVVGESRGVKAM